MGQDLTTLVRLSLSRAHLLSKQFRSGHSLRYHPGTPCSFDSPTRTSRTPSKAPESSFEKAKTWVQTLQRQADPGIIIVLVGNKLDLVHDDPSARRTTREMGEAYAREEGLVFLEASAKTGENVGEIFMEIGECSVGIVSSARGLTTGVARKLPMGQQEATAKRGVKITNGQASATASACQC